MKASLVFVAVFAAVLLLVVPTAAAQDINQFFVPSNVSVDSSFVWMVTIPPGLPEPVRVSWLVDGVEGGLGQFSKIDATTWVCEFPRTCGPSPFPVAGGPYTGTVYVTSETTLTNSFSLMVNDLQVNIHTIVGDDVIVQANVPGYSGAATLTYDLYWANNMSLVLKDGPVSNRPLNYCECAAGFYNETLTLKPGKYYLAVNARTNDGKSGGGLAYIDMGGGERALYVTLDKASYWLGEAVSIRGNTTLNQVSGTLSLPNGSTQTLAFSTYNRGTYKDISAVVVLSGMPVGSYTASIIASTGTTNSSASLSFTVSKLLDVGIPSEISVNESETFRKNYTVKNVGNDTVDLSATTSANLKSYVTATLGSSRLAPGDSTIVTVKVEGLSNDLQGSVLFSTNTTTIEIPVTISVSKGAARNPKIKLSPVSWTGGEGYLVSEGASETFTITNIGTGQLQDFSYTVDGISGSIVNVTFPSAVGPSPDSGSATITLSPASSGNYKGTVTVSSNGGSAAIVVDVTLYSDISSEISMLKRTVNESIRNVTRAGITPSKVPILYQMMQELDSAELNFNDGNYKTANDRYERALVEWQAVGDVIQLIQPAGGDLGLLIGVIAVILVAGGALWFFRLRKKAAPAYEEEAEPSGY